MSREANNVTHGDSDAHAHVAPVSRSLVATVLLAWAAVFWILWITGEWSRFIGARVAWIVPVAALLLTLAGLAPLMLRGSGRPDARPTRSALIQAACMILPALLVLAVPMNTLSTYAAERRNAFGANSVEVQEGQTLSFQQLFAGQEPGTVRDALKAREGERIELVGMVSAPADGSFSLIRFVVACCVVDASVVKVPVLSTAPQASDTWVRVTGELGFDDSGSPQVVNAEIRPTEEPDPPFLYPGG